MHNVGCAWKHRITWWDKNGKILFNLTKLHLTVSKSLLKQEVFLFFVFMMIDIIKVRVRAQR